MQFGSVVAAGRPAGLALTHLAPLGRAGIASPQFSNRSEGPGDGESARRPRVHAAATRHMGARARDVRQEALRDRLRLTPKQPAGRLLRGAGGIQSLKVTQNPDIVGFAAEQGGLEMSSRGLGIAAHVRGESEIVQGVAPTPMQAKRLVGSLLLPLEGQGQAQVVCGEFTVRGQAPGPVQKLCRAFGVAESA